MVAIITSMPHANLLRAPVPLIPGALTGVTYTPVQGVPQENCKHSSAHSTGSIC